MVPDKILRFFNDHANMAFCGLRDHELHPTGRRVSGWRISEDGRTLTALLPEPWVDAVLENLRENGQFAMTADEHPTHETYQIKGQYVGHRRTDARDAELVREIRARLKRVLRFELPPGFDVDRLLRAFSPDPIVAIDVEIRDVFLQTPGPHAGSRVYPAQVREDIGPPAR